jgi:release factor glutamine methyltransferase
LTTREALAEGGATLAAAGIESHSLDAALLLAEVLGMSRSSLIAAIDPITETSLAAFRSLINRRRAGECVAYIVGRKEFYGLEFLVNPSVLVPRPETETLVEAAMEARGAGLRALDLCTGSGAVAVALKHEMPELEVWATDISAEALQVAKTNAARLLPPASIHFCQGDLFFFLSDPHSPFPIPHSPFSYSLILSNPPYIPTADIATLAAEVRAEPVLALDGGEDGLGVIRRIVAEAPGFLCPGGVLLLEADPRQMQSIAGLLEASGFVDVCTYADLSGRERVIRGRKP